MLQAAFAISILALAAALYRTRRLERLLAAERLERLSAAESSQAAIALIAGRVEAIEKRVGRGRRLTPAKRQRAVELLAYGATQCAIARELELREAEVAVLAELTAGQAAKASPR